MSRGNWVDRDIIVDTHYQSGFRKLETAAAHTERRRGIALKYIRRTCDHTFRVWIENSSRRSEKVRHVTRTVRPSQHLSVICRLWMCEIISDQHSGARPRDTQTQRRASRPRSAITVFACSRSLFRCFISCRDWPLCCRRESVMCYEHVRNCKHVLDAHHTNANACKLRLLVIEFEMPAHSFPPRLRERSSRYVHFDGSMPAARCSSIVASVSIRRETRVSSSVRARGAW